MASSHREELGSRLRDFDELMAARDLVCPDGRGRPQERQGAAIIRASVVLLSAAFEAYVEELYEEAVDLLFAEASARDRKALKEDTSQRLNNASTFKVNRLFFNVGIPWIMQRQRMRWQKFSNESVRTELDRIIRIRNQVAHGESPTIRKNTAKRWKGVVERLADRLDLIVSDEVEDKTGKRPW